MIILLNHENLYDSLYGVLSQVSPYNVLLYNIVFYILTPPHSLSP